MPSSPRTPDLDERLNLAEEYAEDPDLTLADIGDRYGVTKERVRQWLAEVDPTAAERHRVAQRAARVAREAQAQRQEQLELARSWEAGVLCVVCEGPRPSNRRTTCSLRCSRLWKRARYNIDSEARDRHQLAVARHRVSHPETVSAAELEFAQRVLAGTAGSHGRWILSDDQKAALAEVKKLRARTRRRWGTRVDAPASEV